MRSESRGHFPQFRFSDGEKWLFNPVLKKRFANRPEERVRLRYVDFLLHDTSITKNRIGFEALVKAYARDNSLRADLVIYTPEIKPLALIECKSERIKLNEKTAQQAARYNLTLKADYLMITNGQQDFWYKSEENSVVAIDTHPLDSSDTTETKDRSSGYWIDRGFLGHHHAGGHLDISSKFLNRLFDRGETINVSYLKLPAGISPEPLDHFYRIFEGVQNQSLALSLVASSSGKTYVSGLLNRDGQNRGVLWFPLDDLLNEESPTAVRITPQGDYRITIEPSTVDLFKHSSNENLGKFVEHLIYLFD